MRLSDVDIYVHLVKHQIKTRNYILLEKKKNSLIIFGVTIFTFRSLFYPRTVVVY